MASEDVIKGYAEGLFKVVQAEGDIDCVEDELFRFGKTLETNNDLRQALADQSLDRAQRVRILEELLGDKFSAHTLGLLTFVVAQDRARQLPQILEQLSELAAEAKSSVVAEVRSAVPLSDEQRKHLAAALEENLGKKVEIKVLVDPSVIGGIHTKIGDTVIDGSIRRRLEQLREQVRA